jgi:hypothetical protein
VRERRSQAGRNTLRGEAGLWLVLLACLCVAACGRPQSDPESRLRETFAEAERAAEAGDFEYLAGRVARDYADNGGRDRRMLLLTLRGLLARHSRLELLVTVREIDVLSPEHARARLDVLAGAAGSAGLAADAFLLELSLRNEGDGWKLVRAEWGRGAGGGI